MMGVNVVGTRRAQGAQKRQRLVEGARRMIYHQGVERTTLADVATEANVAVGNIFYYFKTKDDLVRAVIESRAEQVRAVLGSLQARRSPGARLKALAHQWVEMADLVARKNTSTGNSSSKSTVPQVRTAMNGAHSTGTGQGSR